MSHEIKIGAAHMGGNNAVLVQSMLTTSISNTDAAVEQCLALHKAGAAMARLAVQNAREARILAIIKQKLTEKNCPMPICADVHFSAEVAMIAAQYADKVRINPGNFLTNCADKDYDQTLCEKFGNLLEICRKYGTALRIGVNHGSLSGRMLAAWGNTAAGMVESAMEYLRLCKHEGFENAAVSIKASGARSMVYAVRLLTLAMERENMDYPIHLGVTEAGNGEDGRIKSAVGIGALLLEGIGDTIRVSLTEAPEHEIPAAEKLVRHAQNSIIEGEILAAMPCTTYIRRQSVQSSIAPIGGSMPAAVWVDLSHLAPIYQADIEELGYVFENNAWKKAIPAAADTIYIGSSVMACSSAGLSIVDDACERLLPCDIGCISHDFLEFLSKNPDCILLLQNKANHSIHATRLFFRALDKQGVRNAAVIARTYGAADYEDFLMQSAADCGALLMDGYGDALMLTAAFAPKQLMAAAFGILQASGSRITATEYVACPGCGRTMYDIEKALREVKAKTAGMAGLRIGVMGCIVNGPGEMAGVDYGYVGAGGGMVALYRGSQCTARNVPEHAAPEALLQLILQDRQKN
jgi:(E)-4-hydroxy-3-methylbut-2-enyl-diphosphate synthase